MSASEARTQPIEQALGGVAARVRLLRALRALALYATLGALAATLAGALVGLGLFTPADRLRAQVLAVLFSAWGFALGWMRAPSLLSTALLVDRTHPLGGRIATAVGLVGNDSEMARLAVADALARARTIQPDRAVPWTRPTYARAAGLAMSAALVASTLTPPAPALVAAHVVRPPSLRPLVVHADDLAVLSDAATRLPERHRSPEVRAEIASINLLIEDLSNRAIDRTEALRRLGEIAEGLRRARPGALDATLEALEPLARPLSRSPLSERVGEALAERDPETAAEEMERLAERLETEPPSPSELARLREAMAAAAEALDPETLRREREALEEQRDRLLHRDEEEAALSEHERAERTEERERELERLRREIEERREREGELDSLRRELAEAMRDRESSESGESGESGGSAMERAAEQLEQYGEEAGAEGDREGLEREIEALREMVRRMREGGSGEAGDNGEGSESESPSSGETGESRMDRFVMRARGEGESGEGEGMPIGVPGGGEEGDGHTEGSAGSGGEGEREEAGTGEGAGEGEGEGEGVGRSEMLVLGEGESRLEIPGMGGAGRGEERGPGEGEGESEAEGDGAGRGHESGSAAGDPTGRGGEHTTVRVAGEEGDGPTRSEVIRTSAARGFSSRSYRDVYGDYRRHAEESLEEEEIPPGYRFYVERYFQLIRPRE